MTATAQRAPRRRGPAPALAPDVERRAIFDAALRVLKASGYDRATLDEVLTEASLSTRAFYRHFSSKDELLAALHREEARAVAARLARLTAAAGDPLAALEAWVDDVLAIGFDPKRVERAGLLRSKGARSAAGWEEARRVAREAITEPLVAVLQSGRDAGTFPGADPALDARTICAITFDLLDDIGVAPPRLGRAAARAHVLRFALAALGAAGFGAVPPPKGRSARGRT